MHSSLNFKIGLLSEHRTPRHPFLGIFSNSLKSLLLISGAYSTVVALGRDPDAGSAFYPDYVSCLFYGASKTDLSQQTPALSRLYRSQELKRFFRPFA